MAVEVWRPQGAVGLATEVDDASPPGTRFIVECSGVSYAFADGSWAVFGRDDEQCSIVVWECLREQELSRVAGVLWCVDGDLWGRNASPPHELIVHGGATPQHLPPRPPGRRGAACTVSADTGAVWAPSTGSWRLFVTKVTSVSQDENGEFSGERASTVTLSRPPTGLLPTAVAMCAPLLRHGGRPATYAEIGHATRSKPRTARDRVDRLAASMRSRAAIASGCDSTPRSRTMPRSRDSSCIGRSSPARICTYSAIPASNGCLAVSEEHRPPPQEGAPEGFVLLEPLSRGPHSTVARARSARHGDVILKVLRDPSTRPRARTAFEREARLHAALSPDAAPRPNIVAFIATSTEGDERPWIATRPGGVALADVLARRSLGADEAARISRDILDGLAMLHQRGLAYGDLTPRNILIYNGRATLCDLGLGGRHGQARGSEQIGTPEYMAPELLSDPSRAPDARSDVYAAGLIIGEVVAGQNLTHRLDHLIFNRATSARADDRPADAGEFARSLAAATRHRTPRRRRFRRTAVISVVLLLSVSLAALAWTRMRPPAGMISPRDGTHTVSPLWSHKGAHTSRRTNRRGSSNAQELVRMRSRPDRRPSTLITAAGSHRRIWASARATRVSYSTFGSSPCRMILRSSLWPRTTPSRPSQISPNYRATVAGWATRA